MSYIGDFAVGETLYTKFTTVNTSGVPTQLAGTPAVSAYEDDSVTQITAGITLTVDFDGVTGLNHLTIVASGANGFESGKQYQLVITTGTVGGSSVVGYVVAEFSIEAVAALRPATAGRTLVVDAAGLADANAVKVGPTGAGTAQTAVDIATRLGTPAGASISADILVLDNFVDDLESRLGTPSNLGSGATIAANLVDIESQTDDIGAAGAGLTAIPDSAGVTTLLTRIPAALFSGITSLAQWLGLLAGKQSGNATARTEVRATGAGAGTFDETTDSQEALRDRGDAAWITATGFSTLDAAGVRAAVGLAAANLDTQLAAIDDFLDTEIAAIKAKTDQLTFTTANKVDSRVDNVAGTAQTGGDLAALLATLTGYVDTEVAAILAAVDTEVGAIKAKTDQITFTNANKVDAAVLASADFAAAVREAIADALLGRNIAGGSNTGRIVTSALRKMRNKVAIAAGTMTVYAEDDVTPDHTAAVTTAAGNPISVVDPA